MKVPLNLCNGIPTQGPENRFEQYLQRKLHLTVLHSRRHPFSATMSSGSLETDLEDPFSDEMASKQGHPYHTTDKQQIEKGLYDDKYSRSRKMHQAFLNSWSYYRRDREGTRDLLHFILSYPVNLQPNGLEDPQLQEFLSHSENWKDTRVSASYLHMFLSGTYIPIKWKLPFEKYTGSENLYYSPLSRGLRLKKNPAWAIKTLIHQVSHCILEENQRLISVCGQEALEVTESLKKMPEIQSRFDIILHISIYQHQNIEEVDECITKQIDEFLLANKFTLSLEEEKSCRFLLILDSGTGRHLGNQTLKTLVDRDYACLVLATSSQELYPYNPDIDVEINMGGHLISRELFCKHVGHKYLHLYQAHHNPDIDVDIKMGDHLLPLELFCEHVGHDYHHLSPAHQEMALDILDQCHGHLVGVFLLAKELRKAYEVDTWKEVLDELKSYPSSHIDNSLCAPLIRPFTFIWKRKDANTKSCIHQLATHSNGEAVPTTSVVSSWLANSLVQTEEEGFEMVDDLTASGLLQKESSTIIMREEIKDVMLMPSLDLPLIARAIVNNAEIIILNNSGVTELPDSPICPHLVVLCLQNNCDLMMIPQTFFKHMPLLSTLNLSYTSIKTLPESFSALVSLRRLILRGCDLFLELPPEIGQLSELEVIDLEGTRVMYLPKEIAQLQKLKSLKLSFYACGEGHQGIKQRVPEGVLSNLDKLIVLKIGVNPDEDDDRWTSDVKNILLHLPNRPRAISQGTNIMLYVPDASLLKPFFTSWEHNYQFIVGPCGQRMISRIPPEVEEKFKQKTRLLKYVNGKCIPIEIKDILNHSNAFILDRHWTVKSISEFATGKILMLELCLLVECNELQTILENGNEKLCWVEYLYIYYMKNLRSICSRGLKPRVLYSLKYLSLCTCPSLESIFTRGMIRDLIALEELVVEDCPNIASLVTQDCILERQESFLPRLKKVSLRELPGLVSISNGLKIGPKLEKIVIFYCPKLQRISEVLNGNLKLIKGETEWWDSLPWQETDRFARIFVPLKRDGDLMAQFTED